MPEKPDESGIPGPHTHPSRKLTKQFCKEQGLTEYSFYAWRKRLQEKGPVRFALVERSARRQQRTAEAMLELALATGERLHIGTGVDPATLRVVLDVLRT